MTAVAPAPAPSMAVARRILQFAISRGPLVVFTVLLIYLSFKSEFFLEWRNIKSILPQGAPDAILASGLAVVVMAGGDDVVVGGIDISIPAAATLGVGLIADQLVSGTPLLWAYLLGAAAILAVGTANALLVVYVKLTPLLATLGTLVASVGLYKWAINNRRITVSGNDFVDEVRDGSFFGVPIPRPHHPGHSPVDRGHRPPHPFRNPDAGGGRQPIRRRDLRLEAGPLPGLELHPGQLLRRHRVHRLGLPRLWTVTRHRRATSSGYGAGHICGARHSRRGEW